MIADPGSKLVQDRFNIKVQGETLEKSAKFKQFKVNHHLFYII